MKTLGEFGKQLMAEEKELSREEYLRLLASSRDQAQLNLLMQTVCSTGIRVSEHRYITVEAVREPPGQHLRTQVRKAPGQEPDLGRNEKLCRTARIPAEKVFPHNLRHLFARIYYSVEKDIVRLADILGHTSVNTTRIYTMESGSTHRAQIERMPLLCIT